MGLMDGIKMRKALMLHQKGDIAGAKAAYEALYNSGYMAASYLLPYSVILLKEGGEANYLKVKEVLKKAEKASDMNEDKRAQLLMNYAVAQYKLGKMDEAIHLLELAHHRGHCGIAYQALGFLYIELGDADKALAYNLEALDYDDEDPVTLDNLAQTYYRLLGDKETALKYFQMAHEIKNTQIDTLYFLAQYDLEAGRKADAVAKLKTALEGNFSPLNYATRDMINAQLSALGSAE